jgi:uncharacterized damage-inducible protein DinB
MTYYGSKELAASFRTVRNNTLTIANEIPEEKYSFSPAQGSRTVAQTLVHVAVMWRLQKELHVVKHLSDLSTFDFFTFFGSLLAEEQTPRTKAQIIELLKTEGDKAEAMLAGMSEATLGETVTYPPGMTPPTKSRFEMVMSIKEHEMHHRAQLMTAQRMIGLKPHLTRQMEERIAQMQSAAKA